MYKFKNLRILASKISPVWNTRLQFLLRKKKILHLKNPQTFDEKISWLKLYEYPDNKLVSQCADKVAVRDYISKKGYAEYLNEFYYVLESPEELLKIDSYPNSYVLKWNDDYGSTIVVKDHSEEKLKSAVKRLKQNRVDDFYHLASELHYKNIKPQIICEKYLESKSGILNDYKFYCFNGKVHYIMVCTERKNGKAKYYFYDCNWNIARINNDTNNMSEKELIKKPKHLDKIIGASEKLAEPFMFVRVDWYIINENPIFGEMTFTPSAGIDSGLWPETDKMFGELIEMRESIE